MSLNDYTPWVFIAGFLAGTGVSIVGVTIPDLIAAVRHIVAHLRRRSHAR